MRFAAHLQLHEKRNIKRPTVHRMESLTLAAQTPGNLESHTTKPKKEKKRSIITLQQPTKTSVFLMARCLHCTCNCAMIGSLEVVSPFSSSWLENLPAQHPAMKNTETFTIHLKTTTKIYEHAFVFSYNRFIHNQLQSLR